MNRATLDELISDIESRGDYWDRSNSMSRCYEYESARRVVTRFYREYERKGRLTNWSTSCFVNACTFLLGGILFWVMVSVIVKSF